jgi:hypothetical protein
MCSVDISIMLRPTRRTAPYSYPEGTQSTRACPCETGRASNRRAIFIDFAVVHAKPHGFVLQACAKLAPSGIVDGFRQTSLTQLGPGDIADHKQLRPVDNSCCGLVRPVLPTVGNLGVYSLHTLLFMGTLRHPGYAREMFPADGVFDAVPEGQHATGHSAVPGSRCTAVSSQPRRDQPSRHSRRYPETNPLLCV